MIGNRIPLLRSQAVISLATLGLSLYAAWKIGHWIAAGDMNTLVFVAMGFILCVIALTILRSWRSGFYLFLVWLLFEDLFRKYLGNNMVIYFAKDALAGLTYLSLFLAVRRGQAKTFRPPFLLFLSLFFWLGFIQIFNPYSPSILYGPMGMELYFFYVPMVFVGYALIRNDEDLRRFLLAAMVLTGIIAALGIIQATVGHNFLNPTYLAPEIRELARLEKVTPITEQIFLLPSSVFVSTGRFAFFLILASSLGLGAAGYFILSSLRGRLIILAGVALVAVAVLLSGSRDALLFSAMSALALIAAFLWGAPWRWGQGHRLVKAIRRTVIFAGLGLAIFVFFFPAAAGSRWAFYTETLSPMSSGYQLSYRAWNYPIQNLLGAFSQPHWAVGNGIGTGSLGIQYVSKFLGQPRPPIGVEEGFGQMIVEMGILGPILWILWTAALLWTAWKAIRPLGQTRLFPIAVAILWYAFVLLYPLTYLGLDPYQNYVNNAFLWILVGILFRLPEIQVEAPRLVTANSGAKRSSQQTWVLGR